MDIAAPVSLARRFLFERDIPVNVGDRRACEVLRLLLRYFESIAEAAGRPKVAYDRQLVADILRNPMKYRDDVTLMQAALVAGDVGPDTPMQRADLRRQLPDDGA